MQIDVLNVQYGVTIKLQFVKKKKKKTQKNTAKPNEEKIAPLILLPAHNYC